VLALETDFDGCMKVVQQLASDPEIYLANSMNSLRIEGQKTVGVEVTQQQGWRVPDWVVIPGGNLGNVSALAAGFDLMKTLGVIDRLPRIAVAQAERANPLYRAFRAGLSDATPVAPITAGDTQASAIRIGHPVSWDKAVRGIIATNGVVEQATEGELAEACATADRAGLYACPHTGVAIAATKKLLAAGTIRKSERVVIVSTAHGLKFTEQKLAYHEDQLAARFGVKAGQPNRPVDCAPTLDAVRRALDAHRARFPV
jgi:threonine synthase